MPSAMFLYILYIFLMNREAAPPSAACQRSFGGVAVQFGGFCDVFVFERAGLMATTPRVTRAVVVDGALLPNASVPVRVVVMARCGC